MDAHDFVTISASREVILSSSRPPEDVLGDFLASFQGALREAGCTMVGHVKGMVEADGEPPLFFNLTSLDSEPQYKGGPLRPGSRPVLSMNVIVAGIDGGDVAGMLEETMAASFRT